MFKIITGIVAVGLIVGIGLNKSGETPSEIVIAQDSLGDYVKHLEFGAELYTSTHENADEFLEAIKSKYEGKAVILDLWGTFCKPCLADFKSSSAVKKELKEMDVHMVYLCAGMSSKAEEWEKVITRDQLVGDHIWMDSKLTMAYRKRFDIPRYPNYILIDKEGNFKQHIIRSVGSIQVDRFKAYL